MAVSSEGAVARDADDDARLQRALVALVFFGTILNYVDRQVLSLLKPTLQSAFGWDDAHFAHFASTSQLAALAALFAVGPLIDRFGVKRAYGAAVAIWSLAGMAHAAARGVSEFVTARVVLVAAESINTPAAVKSAAQYLPLRRRSLALGIVNTAPNLGNILAPLTVVPFAVAFGWQAAFLVTGALGFVWLAIWVPLTRRLRPVVGASEERARIAGGPLLRDRRTWAIAGAKALTDMFWWFFTFWLPDLFHKVFNLSQSQLVGPTALAFAMAAAGALTSGWLFSVLLGRGLSVNAARKGSMLLYALLIVPIPLALTAASPWTAAALIGLGLFAHQGFSTNVFGLAADAVPAGSVGSVMAVGAIAGNLTGFLIQEATGRLLSAHIGYAPLFAAAAVAYLLATAWVQLLLPVIRPAHA